MLVPELRTWTVWACDVVVLKGTENVNCAGVTLSIEFALTISVTAIVVPPQLGVGPMDS
jgi:hypothetical protein